MARHRPLLTGVLGLALIVEVTCSPPSQRAPSQTGWYIPLTASADGKASGDVLIHENGAGHWMVMITLQGLEPNSRYAARIRDGACAGAVLHPLERMVVDANGTGHSDTDLAVTPDASWWIEVAGPESLPEPSIACGQVLPN